LICRQKLSLKLHQISRPLAGHAGISDGTPGDPEHATGETEEKPAFQNANLTVWAEPVLPEGWTTSSESDTRPARRRRRSSPSLLQEQTARKNGRRSVSPAALKEGDNPSTREEKAELDWFARSFSPAKLTGSQASKWRSMVISDMFRSGDLYVSQPAKDRWLPSPAWNHVPLPECRAPPIAVSYLVVGPKVRGQFLPEEAKKQGVKPGPDFARITAREEVLLPDGTPVDLDRCFTPGAPAAVSPNRQRLFPPLKAD
jgi:ribonuclease Z